MNIVQKTRAIFRKQEHCSEGRREDDLMSVELILATSSITLALVFYTIGVFKERKAGILRLNHVLFFWTGLVFDVTGTTIMTSIAQSSAAAAAAGDFGIHGLTGLLAIVLMLIHLLGQRSPICATISTVKRCFINSARLCGLFGLFPTLSECSLESR